MADQRQKYTSTTTPVEEQPSERPRIRNPTRAGRSEGEQDWMGLLACTVDAGLGMAVGHPLILFPVSLGLEVDNMIVY